MNDMVDINGFKIKVKGHARVELYDAESNELLEVVEGDNFISICLADFFRQMQKGIFSGYCPNSSVGVPAGSYSTYGNIGFFNFMVLTDSILAESPSTENVIPGNMIGYCTRASYAGTDIHIGSLNNNESWANENKVHWVFDFGTDKANGTIGSVCWAAKYPLDSLPYNFGTVLSSANYTYKGILDKQYTKLMWFEGFYWALWSGNYNTLYKIDPVTFLVVATFAMPGANTYAFCIYGGNFYYNQNNTNNVVRVNLTTLGITVGTGYPLSNYYAMVCCDGTYLYAFYGAAGSAVKRVRLSDLLLQDSKVPPGNLAIYNIYIQNSTTYLVTSSGVYTYDYTNNLTTLVSTIIDSTLFLTDAGVAAAYTERATWYAQNSGVVSNTQVGVIDKIENLRLNNLLARKLLPTPVVKTSAKTMKIIYEFTFA